MSDLLTAPRLVTLEEISGNAGHGVGISCFTISAGEHWAVIGGNGSGKSTFARMLSGEFPLAEHQRVSCCAKIGMVSFEAEQGLLEREIYEDDSEILDRIDDGRTTYELITEHMVDGVSVESLIESLQLKDFLHTGFRLLSTGERRRMMMARALSRAPEMLVLDEPYDGLDRVFVKHLKSLISEISQRIPTVVIVNRMSHIGEYVTHLACLHQMDLVLHGPREEIAQSQLWHQLQAMHTVVPALPTALPGTEAFSATAGEPIVEMRSVSVGYHAKQIIAGLDWKIMPGEHWKVSGANGSGKSTLVNLISGDHPQCYSNEIELFGVKRGTGESIWEVKHHMGLMSTSLHQQYRVTVNAETVLLSGFFDSIGVYQSVSDQHQRIAAEWLAFIHLEHHRTTHFQRLSFGQQRMLLIARALIKRPYLLILDEPCQGLDPMNRALVIQLIETIAARGMAQIVYISHDEEDRLDCITHHLDFIRDEKSVHPEPPYRIDLTEDVKTAMNYAN
ncbi:MAG: molybdate ABC transporter ATP-binding protein ModF [Verrucomicrobiae bacterium]|nr:molybdate ABC transporter ATP-binding protein ModF [Verrucomicrobiae bacterium]NNJ42917.1 molybdate ABC transporter ATP-binding protein ModF [Akkermansiaceae bacterium]